MPVKHISAYSLIIEDGTPIEKEYSKGLLDIPNEDTDREMYMHTVDFLSVRTALNNMKYRISQRTDTSAGIT